MFTQHASSPDYTTKSLMVPKTLQINHDFFEPDTNNQTFQQSKASSTKLEELPRY